MGEIPNENMAFIENQEKVTEKHPMSPECNPMALLAYWLSLFVMSNNRGVGVTTFSWILLSWLPSYLRASRSL